MSKRLTKVLSLVLTLVMFLSVSTPAFALGGGGLGKGWGRDIGEEEIRDFEPAGEIAEEEELDYFQTLDEETGVQVTVEAPMGALPTLAELKFEPVEAEDVLEQLGVSAEEAPDILLALDISFWLNGIEIEPEEPVRVKISAEVLEGRDDLNVIHIPDEDAPEAITLLEEEDLSFSLGTNEIAFVADSFSTYAVTGSGRTATIHYGYIGSNGFVEFPNNSTSSSYPTSSVNAQTVYNADDYTFLIYDFSGYKYKETRLSSTTGTQIWPVLYAERSGGGMFSSYNYRFHYESFSDTTPDFGSELGNNANVYVIYEPLTVTQGSSGSGESGGGDAPEAPDLPASKNVEPNGDGTYDITLSVTGVEVSQEKTKRASVIVIFDRSGSMNNEMDGTNHNGGNNSWSGQSVASINSEARLSIAGKAVIALAEELLDKKDSQGNPLVQMSLITFSDTANVIKFGADNDTYTTDKSAYVSAVNAITATGATNWEAALIEANALEVSTQAPTYVIFVSDGEPTYRISRMDDSDYTMYHTAQANNAGTFGWHNYRIGVIGTGSRTVQAHYDAAARVADSIVTHEKKFYSIGVSTDANDMMSDLVTDAYASSGGIPAGETHYFPGNSQTELKEAFDAIANAVTEDFGFTEVTLDDGVTEMTTVETDALTGTPENFVYRKGSNQDDPTQNPVWTGDNVPEATITGDNHVIWDTSQIGSLEPDVTYSVTFTVWPSQESYDIIADINNGIIRNADGSINRIGTPAEAYAAQPPEVQAQIVIVGSVYTLLTNTGVNLSYKFNGNEGSNTVTVKKEGSMPLDTSYFGVTKVWNNGIDMRTANALTVTVGEGDEAKTYIVDKDGDFILDDGGNPIEYDRSNPDPRTVFYVDLIVTEGKGEDQTDYTEIRLTSQDNWIWDQMFIAPGVITHEMGATSGALTIRETGRDYSVREKPGESYYWNLSAEVYHPMVINGESVVLQLVDEDDTGAPDLAKNTFQGNYYNVDGEIFKKLGSADSALITAINDRRSMLYVTKEVEEAEGAEAPEDALFSFQITMDSPNDPHPEDEDYDEWYNTFWFAIQTDPEDRDTVINDDEDIVVDGATAEDGNTGFYWFDNGGTVKVSIKAGQYIVFTNLPLDTQYTITELDGEDMPEGFIFKEAEPAAEPNITPGYEPTAGEVVEDDPMKVTGTIDASNSNYSVTYTNTYLGCFYVYHSSDLSVERFPMAVNGVAYKAASGDDPAVTFNIFELTKEGTLYGGYYEDYAGKSASFDAAALDYSGENDPLDEGATAYSYQAILDGTEWNYGEGYDVDGQAMIPVSNTVYYLKEVPTGYLRPYTHYTYFKDETKSLGTVWTISATDDLNYQKAGFIVVTQDMQAVMLESMVIKAEHSTASTTLSAAKVFKSKGVLDGYLGYADISAFKGNDGPVAIRQYWTTKDNIQVFGTMMRELSFGDGTVTGLKKTDKAFEPLP